MLSRPSHGGYLNRSLHVVYSPSGCVGGEHRTAVQHHFFLLISFHSFIPWTLQELDRQWIYVCPFLVVFTSGWTIAKETALKRQVSPSPQATGALEHLWQLQRASVHYKSTCICVLIHFSRTSETGGLGHFKLRFGYPVCKRPSVRRRPVHSRARANGGRHRHDSFCALGSKMHFGVCWLSFGLTIFSLGLNVPKLLVQCGR